MIRYSLNLLNVEISLDSDGPHTPAPIVATGDPDMVPVALNWLANQHGAYGHGIGDATTPVDLAVALTKTPLRSQTAGGVRVGGRLLLESSWRCCDVDCIATGEERQVVATHYYFSLLAIG